MAPRLAASRLLAATGEVRQAVVEAQEARGPVPDVRVLEQVASIYADAGDAAGLRAVLPELRYSSGSRRIYYYEAAVRFLGGDLDGASRYARQATEAEPEHAPAWNLLGAITATMREPEQARQAFESALSLDPRDSATYLNLGLLHLSQGRRLEAAEYLQEALSLNPASQEARGGWKRAVGRS